MNSLFISEMEITQPFKANPGYYEATDGHEGVDVVSKNRNDYGVHIPRGFDGGKVVYDGDVSGQIYGRQVKVWFHKLRVILQFCHLSENVVDKGQTLNSGDIIGVMGNTGISHGNHTHFNAMPTDKKGNILSHDPKKAYINPMLVLEDPEYCIKNIKRRV